MMNLEFIGQVSIYFGMGVQIVTALILGGLVGYDREKKMKSAGFKTNILICIGATLYTSISILNQVAAGGVSDPNRTAAQIVSGIGFLGAGAIIQGRGNVIGLTTAATIWVVAAIGVTIGSGYPFVATIFTVTILLVLKLLDPLYRIFELKKDFKDYHFEILSQGGVKKNVREILLRFLEDVKDMDEEVIDFEHDKRILNVYVHAHPRKVLSIAKEIKHVLQVEKVSFRQIEVLDEGND